MSHPQETFSYGIDLLSVKLIELAIFIDQNYSLMRLFRERVIADSVMREVIENFQSKEVAWCAHIHVPIEYGAIDDFYMSRMATSRGGGCKLRSLAGSQGGGDFDDFELDAFIDIRMNISDVVENVKHQGPISSAKFVDDEIMEGMMSEHVVCDQVTGYGFAVMGTK